MFITPLPESRIVAGQQVELLIRGEGQPLLFLHAGHGFEPHDPLVAALSKHYKVYAPSHPGFGASDRPDYLNSVEDLVFFYLDLLEQLDLREVILVGVSFGGWLAAELATRGTGRIAKLVLIDAVGVKFSGRETRDIVDIFATTIDQIPSLFFHDSEAGLKTFGNLDFKGMTLESTTRFARNRESILLFGWSPTLYNPKLLRRLNRVHVPVLVLWGADDKVVATSYGKQYAAAFEHGVYREVAGAGHYGYLEKPAEFSGAVIEFLATNSPVEV
jgi:pimeloyl-ACP methyl ester carboxylesterase